MNYWHSHYGLLSLLSYVTQDHLTRGGTAPNGLGLTILVNDDDDDVPTELSTVQSDGGIFSAGVPPPRLF